VSASPQGRDARSFYAALGVRLPDWAHTEAPVRCFADPNAHTHEDRDASCSVSLESGAFNCHGCGAHGGAYDAALALGRSPREAMDLLVAHGLAERRSGSRGSAPPTRPTPAPRTVETPAAFAVTGVQVGEWASALATNAELLARLRDERGWDKRTLRDLRVGFDGQRITVPIPGKDGGVQGLLRLRVEVSHRPKVLAVQGTRLGLIPRPAGEEEIWLVEGPSDMLAARSGGLPAIAVPGTHAWRPEYANEFADRQMTVVMDADPPGRHAALRIACDLEQHGAASVRILELAEYRDDGYDLSDWRLDDNRPALKVCTTGEFRQLLDGAYRPPTTTPAVAQVRKGRSHGCLRF
jgi:hypothetical protein